MRLNAVAYYADYIVYPALLLTFGIFIMPAHIGTAITWALFVLLGGFLWTFLEYVTHRFAFHQVPALSRLHLAHHDDQTELLGTPFWVGAPFFALLFGLFVLVLGREAGGGIGMGLMAGYIWYIFIHEVVHKLKFDHASFFYRLKRSHALHHFRSENCNFGVTTGLWDRVFGTEMKV